MSSGLTIEKETGLALYRYRHLDRHMCLTLESNLIGLAAGLAEIEKETGLAL